MSTLGSNHIQITHVINAHLFWFENANQSDPNVDVIEKQLQKYVDESGDDIYADRSDDEYKNEDIVAVYLQPKKQTKKKWIRAEVDVIDEPAGENEVIVWATDYGYPVKTTLDSVVLLSPRLKEICSVKPAIFKGGIWNILPASTKINSFNQARPFETKKWDSKVIETLKKTYTYSKVTVHFERKFETKDHVFGDLKVRRDNGEEKSFADIFTDILRMAIATPPDKFKKNIVTSTTINIKRWLDNNGHLNCIENGKSISTSSSSGIDTSSINSSPASSSSNHSLPQQESAESNGINQHDMIQRISRMALTLERAQNTNQASETTTAQSVQKMQTRSTQPSVRQSTASIQSKQPSDRSKKPTDSSQPVFTTQSLPLAQLKEPSFLLNKIKSTPIFVRNNVEEPIDSIKSAPFTSAVHRGMTKMNLQETYLIQGYAWPNLVRGNSMILVDSQNRGKTTAYLPAVCSIVQRELEDAASVDSPFGSAKKKVLSKMGATVIIVCLSSNVQKIAADCRTILQMPTFQTYVVEGIGTRDYVSVTVKLYNGCNILVTTAPCLMDLISKTPHLLKSNRLKCIVFENFDCLMAKQPEPLNFIVKNLCSRKSYKGEARQFIVTSRTWTPNLVKFLNEKEVVDSVLVIGNHLEAAFCAGVLLHFRLCKSEVKLNELTEHIQTISYRTERTMIVCNDSLEAAQVQKHLESKKIPNELVIEVESNYAQAKIKSFWDKIEGILICTDAHLTGDHDQKLQINNVQHIMHFSVPIEEFTQFLGRHSTLLDFYAEGNNKEKATSTIFLDDNNFRQLPKLVELLTRNGQQVPKQVLELSQKARLINIRERAEKRRFESICNSILMHGVTEHQATCRHRHLLLPSDNIEESELIASGHLRFKALKIISPTEYIIRPTAHSAGNNEPWKTINNFDEFNKMVSNMQAYYKDPANRKILQKLELGEKCVVETTHETFERAEIIAIIEKRKITESDTYEIRFVDSGEVDRRNSFELYILEEQFQTVANQAYHLHLTSVIPADKEEDWDPQVCDKVRKHLNELNNKENDLIYEAIIVFSLRNTIVVDTMRLICLKNAIVHCYLKTYLQRHKFGIISKDSRDKVIEMAKAAGIKIKARPPAQSVAKLSSLPEKIKASPKANVSNATERRPSRVESDTPLITFDDTASESFSQDGGHDKFECPWKAQHKNIYISQFYSPTNFYVVQRSEKLDQLYNAIYEYTKSLDPNASMDCPDVYKYCLVLGNEGYNRAKVIEIIYGEDIELKVFLVDTGFATTVDISKVHDIPDNLIEMLPFQAIWCNMVGIKPIENDEKTDSQWTDEDQIDAIYDAIDEYSEYLFLHTVSTNKSIKSKIADTEFVRHDIVLVALPDQEPQININEMLVTKRLADFDPNTQHILDNIPNLLDDDSDADSESDWEDECKINEHQNKWLMLNNQPKAITPKASVSEDFEQLNALLNDDSFMSDADSFLRALYNGDQGGVEEKYSKVPDVKPKQHMESGYTSSTTHEHSEDDTDIETKSENVKEELINASDRHQLEYIYKRPQVFWWQTDEMIVLKIKAHDNVKYGLEVSSEQLIYGTVNPEIEQIVAVIHFFGCVEYELTSQEVRGLNVIIRLHKSCPIKWPRLLLTAQKSTWIIQNIDAIKDEIYYDKAMEEFNKAKEDDDESEEDFSESIEPSPAVQFDLEDDERSFDEAESASF